jgi:hypothetical protein
VEDTSEEVCDAYGVGRGSFTQQRLGLAATVKILPPVLVFLSQMPPDDFFAHSKGTPTEAVINGSKNTQYVRL